MNYIKKARGFARLENIEALPVIDTGADIKYEGSISKIGDNADWDWGMYTDDNGEWVLMEADGPGCIFNFTQHRYPTSEVPVFRFYFDNSENAQFEITPAEFGTKPPFIKPFADKFVGPDDNGRGPIWVVRSFVPMEFRTHCKVTSSIKLEGAEKDKGQGGWGHITYHLYDSDEGLETFTPDIELSNLAERYRGGLSLGGDNLTESKFTLSKGESKRVFSLDAAGVICGISLKINNFKAEYLKDVFVRICFDGKECVNAPIGTFFGCEYGNTPANIKTALLSADFEGENAFFTNGFPMPFFENCTVDVCCSGDGGVLLSAIVENKNSCAYDRGNTGYFTSSTYYPKTVNTKGKNSVIAGVKGHGQMVYGVISGEDIACGCEGDVRVFIDGVRSPAVESDGSESWGSYGWGFVCPPQCNPFSAYNGVPDINDTWSELRLTFSDSYPFRSELRFELEHGCRNDGGGKHSGQIFCYMKPENLEVPVKTVDFAGKDDAKKVTDRFENGIHEDYKTFFCRKSEKPFSVEVSIPENNRGIAIKRVALQKENKMLAAVLVDGVEVCERNWFFPDSNPYYSFTEDLFLIPAKYTCGKTNVRITIKPLGEAWNECEYNIFAIGE